MQRYIAGRLIQCLVTLLVISLLVFALARLTGNPLDVMLPIDASAEIQEEMSRELGLDQPVYVQYARFVQSLLHGDLGTSIRTRKPVAELIGLRLPNTLKLVSFSTGMALLIALPLGVIAATRKSGFWDVAARTVALFGQSVPTFWAGIVLITIFAVNLDILPAGRKEGIESYVLPAVTLGLFGFMLAGVVRLLRGSMLDVLDSEYVKFARMKGLAESVVTWKHALKNALIPVVTFVGFYFGILMAGSVVVETVFAWPGIGRLAFEAVQWRDYPVIQGVVLLVSTIILAANLVVDILYAYIDPRIRYG
ncbi:MAG: ABC transporter permease [Deltaproteobacteria bacterium]|nr:ABC transporter permease [Deltaproteobacteria bacterium]